MIKAPNDMWGLNAFEANLTHIGINYASKLLGTTPSTIKRWIKTDSVPRYAVLVTFWESRYGRSMIDAHNHWELCHLGRKVCEYETELLKAKRVINALREQGDFDTANDPMFENLGDVDAYRTTEFLPFGSLTDDERTAYYAAVAACRSPLPPFKKLRSQPAITLARKAA